MPPRETFLACIAMASTAVEIILNRDRRLRALPKFKASDGWAYLNNRNSGLPEKTVYQQMRSFHQAMTSIAANRLRL